MSPEAPIIVYERLARLETLAQTQAEATKRIETTLGEVSRHLDSLRLWKAKVTAVAAVAAAAATVAARLVEAAFK